MYDIKNRDREKPLGTDIDCKFSFENHINQICNKARAKIKALARISPFLEKKKKKATDECIFQITI